MPTDTSPIAGSRFTASAETLANEAVGSIFTVPEATWTTIDQRVGMAHLVEGIETQIAQALPGFPALATACDAWRTTTFPGLVQQSGDLTRHCTTSIQTFTSLQLAISGLDPGAPLPPELHALAVEAIGQVHDSAVACGQGSDQLAGAVGSFREANDLADAQLAAYAQRLGPDWGSLVPSTSTVDAAAGLVYGAWEAISADLEALVSGTIPITTQLLISLEIQSAISSWTNLEAEATAFASMAGRQASYLDGSWLSGGD